MKVIKLMLFVFLGASLLMGQNSTQSSGPAGDTNQVTDQIKALQTAIAEQQKQLEALQRQLEEQKKAAPQVLNTSLNTAAKPETNTVQADVEKPKESPLSVRIGGTDFTPGGFVDFENVFRTTNSGSQVSTNFGTIPFSNQPQGHLTEFRVTGQYSRVNLKITGKYAGNDITGYIESDFNGNSAATVYQTTNPHTFRLRLYWVDLKRGSWEFLGGSSWGLETPNRVGISPLPADLAVTLNEDGNINVGIPYTRAGLFRAGWHPSKKFAWGFEVQNPQQFTNGAVVFPAAFNTGTTNNLNLQFDPNNGANIPNELPDFLTKLAYDSGQKHHFHVEAGAVVTTVKVAVQQTGATTFTTHSKSGTSGFGAFNFELFKNFRVLANGMYGAGGARYFVGQGPQVVVAPVAIAPTIFDVTPSMVHSGGGLAGVEFQMGPKTQVGAYYAGDYFQRNTFQDITATTVVKPFIGFGGPASATTNNKSIQEGTLDLVHTFWRNPSYGALVLINQASYLTRAPWFVSVLPTPAPKNAHLFMDYLSLRYVLP